VEFAGTVTRKFSLIEMEVPGGSLASFGGLMVRFASAPPAWTIRLGDGSRRRSKTRYIAVLDGTDDQSVFVPWSYFKGQSLHVGRIDYNGQSIAPQDVKTIGIMLPGSKRSVGASGNFALRELAAAPFPQGVDQSIALPVILNSAGEVASNPEVAQCACDFNCGRCALLKQLSSGICSSSQYEQLCLVSAGGLMRRLAAGFSDDTCTSEKAVDARHWLQISQYIEKCLPNNPDAVAVAIQDVMQGLLRTHFNEDSSAGGTCEFSTSASNLTGFVGPFIAMGISGYNDLGVTKGVTVETCLESCRANSQCRSIDYGARDKVIGECWLSTANRESAGDAYTTWPLYDYYEVSDDGVDSSSSDVPIRQTALEQASAIAADKQNALLESVGLLELDCCKQPSSCIQGAITVGVPRYNQGDVVSCFFVYHAAASRIGKCGDKGTLDYPKFLQIAALTGASDVSANSAAWQLRRALDIALALKSGTCRADFPPEDDVVAVPSPKPSPAPAPGMAPAPAPAPGMAPAPAANLEGELAKNFVGPFQGMGISGYNDLDVFYGKSVPDCLEECLKQPRCKSVDFGARGQVTGECWLSTADRSSASGAYSAWELYDYYERIPPEEVMSAGMSAEQDDANSQADTLNDPVASSSKEVRWCGIAMFLLVALRF
jgi:hypothetical protein